MKVLGKLASAPALIASWSGLGSGPLPEDESTSDECLHHHQIHLGI